MATGIRHQAKNNIEISGFSNLYPFTSHFFERNGLKYHFVDEGAGDPIVMLHGNPTWSFYFRTLVKEFSSEYRTIVIGDRDGNENMHFFSLIRWKRIFLRPSLFVHNSKIFREKLAVWAERKLK